MSGKNSPANREREKAKRRANRRLADGRLTIGMCPGCAKPAPRYHFACVHCGCEIAQEARS